MTSLRKQKKKSSISIFCVTKYSVRARPFVPSVNLPPIVSIRLSYRYRSIWLIYNSACAVASAREDSMKTILYVRISFPQSDVKVIEYFSNLSCNGIVIGSVRYELVCWARVTRSILGTNAFDDSRYVLWLLRTWLSSDMFVPPSSNNIASINLPVVVSEKRIIN